ncbi:MAG: prolipoprotein diacylglyceryl transferase [Actinobacteria bacterium]|nr:prolipoprotein diacylglyceryl transferase [Actinomycetota bacterium]MCB9388497.1 prolipoprotein diacylglyceryl transferase [Acidimicrobiia bacterium]
MDVLASIPSPTDSAIDVGPLTFRAYGLFVALGVMFGYLITQKRWANRGGNPDDIARIAMWAIPAGVVGARLYHVMTDYHRFQGNWGETVAIWHGGLAIWGAIAGGALAAIVYCRVNHLDTAALLECAAPALPVAQAIGRLGNYFNQELYGKPTSLPWGLEIDIDHRPVEYLAETTFHPTFLYEALWNLALAAFIVWVAKRVRLPRGRLFLVYVAGYTFIRFFMELLRVDEATKLFGQRINLWVTTIVFAAAVYGLLSGRDRRVAPADTRPIRVWNGAKLVDPAIESAPLGASAGDEIGGAGEGYGDEQGARDRSDFDAANAAIGDGDGGESGESPAAALARVTATDPAISGNVVTADQVTDSAGADRSDDVSEESSEETAD